MVTTSFNPTTTHIPRNSVINDPYVRVDIEAKDHNYLYFYYLRDWSKSAAVEEKESMGEKWIQIPPKSASSTVNLTKTFTIGKAGWYHIRIRARRGPKLTGTMTLSIAGTQLDDSFNPYNTGYTQDHITEVDMGVHYLSAASTAFQLAITKNVMVTSIRIQRVEKYSTSDTPNTNPLHLKSMEWTQNSVSELNTAELTLAMKDEYYDLSNDYSRLKFDFADRIRVFVGQNYRDTKCMFGGYIEGYKENLKENTINLYCVDRLYDLYRKPIFNNFKIGRTSSSPENNNFPLLTFGNVQETCRYLAETNQIRLSGENIYSYVTDEDTRASWGLQLGNTTEYNTITASKYVKYLNTKYGNPKPSLQVTLNSSSAGEGYVTLFSDNSRYIDASELNMFSMQYKNIGKNSKYFLPFDLAFKMHTADETYGDAEYYYVKFTGYATTNIIGSITPKTNSNWNSVSIDLGAMFDKYYPSTNYYISEISLKSTIPASHVSTRELRNMLFENIWMYNSTNRAAFIEDGEIKYPAEHIRDMCKRANFTAYIDYHTDPRRDSLILQPEKEETLDTVAREGVTLLDCSEIEYMPRENLCNASTKSYNINDEKIGLVYSSNHESYQRYDYVEKYEELTEISSKGTAQSFANNEVGFNKYQYPAFTVTIMGSTDLKPDQYLSLTFDSKRLTGTHEVKSITHHVDFENNNYISEIDLGEPSRRFRNLTDAVINRIKKQGNQHMNSNYNQNTLRRLGNTSPGGFIGVR